MVTHSPINAPILKFNLQISPQAMNDFVKWQGELHEALAATNGFVSLEIIAASLIEKSKWKIAIRFVNNEACSSWQHSEIFSSLMAKVQPMLKPGYELKIAQKNAAEDFSSDTCVTELFITNLRPGMESEFRAWIAKIHQTEATFPGFSGVYVQSPSLNSKHWVTFLQFDSQARLDYWLVSPQRQAIVEQSKEFLESLESHHVITSFPGWFNSITTGNVATPPLWKQAMLILLVLFPIVMLEGIFLNPFTGGLNASVAMFIGNLISVSLVTWPMMPLMIYWMDWWLAPVKKSGMNDMKGLLLIVLLYALEIWIFTL
jgi:antibiotic biosynthesis monooxygenase (ABM) superfamily enzyme